MPPVTEPALGERFREALLYAAELHAGQTRKGGTIPYVGHLLIVAGTVIEWGGTEDQAIGAILHDAIEDQPHQNPEGVIRRRFGDAVADVVIGLSDADVLPKTPWLERKQAYFERLEKEPQDVVVISAADKLHNARAILADFVAEGESLWPRFSIPDQGAVPQLWYFNNLLTIYERRLPKKFTWELRATVEELARRTNLSLNDLPTPERSPGE
ncbi:MAG TPA: HD domain-containing protein [Fimbriimonadaceae bacterium]|jgi:(p)ppGpp synthase/HD superfamily hydrolase|nr:HD domain-containing protein [Fimbriimonadaceae bacterium]